MAIECITWEESSASIEQKERIRYMYLFLIKKNILFLLPGWRFDAFPQGPYVDEADIDKFNEYLLILLLSLLLIFQFNDFIPRLDH